MILYINKASYYKGQSPHRKLNVNLREWPQGDRRKICKAVANDWGEINKQRTIYADDETTICWFSCSGHGGYVVFSSKKINWPADHSCEDYGEYQFPMPWYIYCFEEDCAWAVLWEVLPQRAKWKDVKVGWGQVLNDRDAIEQKVRELDSATANTRRHYYPDRKKLTLF